MTPEQKEQVTALRLAFAMERRTQYLGRDDEVAAELRRLQAQVEALQADADRLNLIYKNLEFDGSYWLPEWCVKECFNVQYAVAPSFEEFRAAIDARKDQT